MKDLEKEYYRLQFLVDEGNNNLQKEMEVSIAAGEIVGLLYDALAKQYVDPTTERAMKKSEYPLCQNSILPVCRGCGHFWTAWNVSRLFGRI